MSTSPPSETSRSPSPVLPQKEIEEDKSPSNEKETEEIRSQTEEEMVQESPESPEVVEDPEDPEIPEVPEDVKNSEDPVEDVPENPTSEEVAPEDVENLEDVQPEDVASEDVQPKDVQPEDVEPEDVPKEEPQESPEDVKISEDVMEEETSSQMDCLRISSESENSDRKMMNNENEHETHIKTPKSPIKSGIRPPKAVIRAPIVSTPQRPQTTSTPVVAQRAVASPRVVSAQPSPRPSSKMSRERSDIPHRSTSTRSIDNVGKFTPKVNAKFVNVKSKVGSVTNHKPGGGNVEIFSEKKEYSAQSKVGSLKNANHVAGGGNVQIESRKLNFSNATSKVGSKTNYVPAKSDVKIVSEKLTWNAKSKVGSMDNAAHKPTGGNVQILSQKLEWKAESKVGSKDNMNHRPGGGNVKVISSEVVATPSNVIRQSVVQVTARPKMSAVLMKRKSFVQRTSSSSLVMSRQFPGSVYPLTSDFIFY